MADDGFTILGTIRVDDQGTAALTDFNKALSTLGMNIPGLKAAMVGLGEAFAGLAILKGVGTIFSDVAKAAEDDQKNLATLTQVMRNNIGATDDQVAAAEKQINTMARQTGIAHDQLIPAYSNLVAATKDSDKAFADLSVAMDIASAKHIDLTTVTNALVKAEDGNVSGLSRLGVETKDAEGKTMSLNEIMKELTATYGGAANAASNTLAGSIAKLKETFSQLAANIGSAIIPAITTIVNAFTKLADVFIDLPKPMQQTIVVLGGLAAAVVGLSLVINPVITLFTTLSTALAAHATATATATTATEAQTAASGEAAAAASSQAASTTAAASAASAAAAGSTAAAEADTALAGAEEAAGAGGEVMAAGVGAGAASLDGMAAGAAAAAEADMTLAAAEDAAAASAEAMEVSLAASLGSITAIVGGLAALGVASYEVAKTVGNAMNSNSSSGPAVQTASDGSTYTVQTQEQLDQNQQLINQIYTNAPQYALGGGVRKTGLAYLHENETVLTGGDTSLMKQLIAALNRPTVSNSYNLSTYPVASSSVMQDFNMMKALSTRGT